MKKLGRIILLVVLVLSTYLMFLSQFETTKITLFTVIGMLIGFGFIISDRITSVKAPFLELRAEIDKARSDVKEIEDILKNVQSQKETIDLIVRDGNSVQKKIIEIEKNTQLKSQQIDDLFDDAKKRIDNLRRNVDGLQKKINDVDKNFDKRTEKYLSDFFKSLL